MQWNPSQKQAIDTRGKNILVSAAAGSGKTAVLVERIKQLVVKDKTGIDNMLIVTFTNAAAGEMRERIMKAITQEMRVSASAFLQEQLSRIHSAQISTFHSFCLDVIRRYFYLIDIKPDVRICDEAQKTILLGESMEALFEQAFASDDGSFRSFLHKYADSRNEEQVKSMILLTYQFIQSIPEPFVWLETEIEALKDNAADFTKSKAYQYASAQIREDLLRAQGYLAKVLELAQEAGTAGIEAKAQKDAQMLEDLTEIFERKGYDAFAEAVLNIKFATFTASKEEKEAFEGIKEEAKFLRDKGKGIIKAIAEKYASRTMTEIEEDSALTYEDAKCLQRLVGQFHDIYGQKKADRGLIDFNDAEHFALNILENAQAADEYRKKFDYIFIDEYQDSNVVQETLISRIKRADNLFMVGDVKQSIYKFRLAEPEIFMEKYERFRSGQDEDSMKIDLSENFRSKGGVIGLTNMVFEAVMTKASCGMDYDEEARLRKGLAYSGALDCPAEIHIVDETMDPALADQIDDEIKEMKKTELEAAAAAAIIKNLTGQYIFDDKLAVERKITYRDIVVLFRAAKAPAMIYQEIFKKENIPVYAQLDDDYFDTIEIGTFLNLLRVLDNKRQDLPLLSVLRSGIFGFDTGELVDIRLTDQNVPYHEAFLQAALAGEKDMNRQDAQVSKKMHLYQKCAKTHKQLQEWSKLSQIMPLEEFIWKLLSESGYYEYAGAMPGGLQRKANLRALADKAAAFQSGQAEGLFGFIQYAQQLRKTGVSVGQVRLLGEKDDVVRIMTVHKSKGLEFPVVIAAGLGRRFNMTRESYKVSLHRRIGLALRYVREEDYAWRKTFAQEIIEQQERRESVAEEMRILYVALTRAKDRLILLGTLKDAQDAMAKYRLKGDADAAGAMQFFDWILPVALQNNIVPVLHGRTGMSARKQQEGRHKEIVREGLENGFLVARTPESIEAERKLSWMYPHRAATELPSKYAVSELSKMNEKSAGAEIPQLLVPQTLAEGAGGRLTASERGSAMHSVLSHIDLKKPVHVKSIRAQVAEMVQKEILTEEEAAAVHAGKISAMLESPLGKRMSAADQIYREMAFVLKKSVRDLTEDVTHDSTAHSPSTLTKDAPCDVTKDMPCDVTKDAPCDVTKDTTCDVTEDAPGRGGLAEGEEVLIQGAIDCCFEEGGKWVLVDYKTDKVRMDEKTDRTDKMRTEGNHSNRSGSGDMTVDTALPGVDEIIQRYRAQLSLYKEALETLKGIRVEETYLYLFSAGCAVPVKL